MFKRSHYIALGLVALIALVILNLPSQTSARLRLALGGLFLPLFGLAGASQQAVGKAADTLVPRSELQRQVEALSRENKELKIQALQAAELTRENEHFRALYQWQQRQGQWKLKLAHVTMRDPANWWRSVRINLGTTHGIRTNMPVLTTEGLVGRIHSVGLTDSLVVLIGDPRCNVSARVDNETRDVGVIVAGTSFDPALVQMNYLPRNATIKPGQNVVTSGEGVYFPKGIPIGRVMDARPAQLGLYTEARIKVAANLSGIEEVWVLTQ